MITEPRVLLSVDYESWVALLQREYNYAPSTTRQQLDDGYTLTTLDDVLEVLDEASVSLYLVGEIANWYPEIPQKIVAAGHELGFHSHVHRPLTTIDELNKDLNQSTKWLRQYNVRGYRAPIINISRESYSILAKNGLEYSSSTYGPTGKIKNLSGIWEIPVSTWSIWQREPVWWWPRRLSIRLFSQGEFPYGSSFIIGLLGERIFYWLERELRQGRSPVLVLHNYQIVPPPGWPRQIKSLLCYDPLQSAFVFSRKTMLKRIFREFPVDTIGNWLDEQTNQKGLSKTQEMANNYE